MIVFTSRFDWLIVYKKLPRCWTVQAPVFILFKYCPVRPTYKSGFVRMGSFCQLFTRIQLYVSKGYFLTKQRFLTEMLGGRYGWQMRIVLTSVTNFQNVYWLLYCAAKSQFIMILTMFFSKFAFCVLWCTNLFLRFQLTLIDGSFVLHSLHYMSDNLSEALIRR